MIRGLVYLALGYSIGVYGVDRVVEVVREVVEIVRQLI